MLELVFAAASGPTLVKGPYASFCLQGETLRERIGGPPIAVHEDQHWLLDGRRFTRFDCDGHLTVYQTRVEGWCCVRRPRAVCIRRPLHRRLVLPWRRATLGSHRHRTDALVVRGRSV